MLINPLTAIKNGWIKGIRDEDIQVQPNAIDFTLDNLFLINHGNICIISDDKSELQMRGGEPLAISNVDDKQREWWTLGPNDVYDALSDIYVDLPKGVACKLIIRSTFNRNGFFITSGLYDSGYKGHIGFALHNRSGAALIQKGVRVGQIEFYTSDAAKEYAGGWNHDQGTHWSKDEESVDVMGELNG